MRRKDTGTSYTFAYKPKRELAITLKLIHVTVRLPKVIGEVTSPPTERAYSRFSGHIWIYTNVLNQQNNDKLMAIAKRDVHKVFRYQGLHEVPGIVRLCVSYLFICSLS